MASLRCWSKNILRCAIIVIFNRTFFFLAQKYRQKKHSTDRIKAAGKVVHYAKENLTREFSRIYRCTPSDSPETNLSLEINCLCATLYSEKSSAWKLTFPEIKKVTFEM